MKLDAWLREDHSLDAKLRVIERLCQAVNAIHDGGEALAALEPSRIEIGPEGRCDLSAAHEGSPAHTYRAPDREDGAPLGAADIYAVGAIAWEMLAGRPPAASPSHLSDVRPALERELADAVMACLEPSAAWRPKDLTYLAQMAAARQKKKTPPPSSGTRAPRPPRMSTPRPGTRRPRRRTWPLLAALALVAGLAVVAALQLLRPGVDPSAASPRSPVPPTTVPALPTVPTQPTPEVPVEPPAATSGKDRSLPLPLDVPPAPPSDPRPSRSGASVDSPPPPRGETGEAETRTGRDATPPPPPPQPSEQMQRPAAPTTGIGPGPGEPAPPPEPSVATPPVLTAVSPLQVRSPGKVLIDLHGTGFGPQHRVRVLPVKKVPWGITVVRQKLVGGSLITVLMELKDPVEPGEYALAVEDGLGTRSEPVIFEVTQ